MPHDVVDGDRRSYDVLEDFQGTLLAETVELERRVRRELADGERHVHERRLERRWKERIRERIEPKVLTTLKHANALTTLKH